MPTEAAADTTALNNDETRPLLESSGSGRDHGTIEREAGNGPIKAATSDNGTVAARDGDEPDDQGGSPVIEEEITTLELSKVMASIWLGSFLAALDSTLVATLSGPISTQFKSLTLFSWLASSYFIANAALQPLSGKLTDIFGRRAGLIFSNIFFAAGNLICGLAESEGVMITGRVVAGMGGGGLTAISTFIASDLVPLRRRGVWQGIGNIMYGIGAGLGGVFGGWMHDRVGWRWAFLVQVPVSVLSTIVVIWTVRIPVKDTGENRLKRIDFAGATLLVITLVLLLSGLNSGGNIVPWTHPLVLTSLPLSGVAFAAYLYVEARVAREPIIPVQLLTQRTPLAACLTNWFVTQAVFGLLFYVPIYYQARGYSATAAGARLMTNSLGIAFGSIAVGLLMRRLGRYWWVNVGVQATELVGLALVCSLDRYTPDVPPFFYFILTGTGYSGMLTLTLVGLISAVEHRFQAVITSASYAFRSTGSTIGITIASAVFQNVLTASLWRRLGDRKGAEEYIPRIRDSLDEIGTLPEGWRDPVVDSYMDATRAVFVTLFGIAALGAAISLLMREHKLYNTVSRRDS